MKQTDMYKFINQFWDNDIIPTLMEYIKIPNKSPAYDKNWYHNGYMQQAVQLIANWCKQYALPQMTLDIIQLENKTPIILIDVPGEKEAKRPGESRDPDNDTVLLYGHLDKQPELTGWDKDLGPWKPVMRGDRLYGRGAADDGYSVFSALTALKALKQQNIPHSRCVILIEASEESGSVDLPFYIDHLQERFKNPSLVICLDSGCGNYDQLWVTTSLRGLLDGILTVEVLKDGIHSGVGSGAVPSAFRIAREILDRIEDGKTGDVLLKELHTVMPEERQEQAHHTANILDQQFISHLPFLPGVKPEAQAIYDLIVRTTWKPALSVTGVDGIPPVEIAGNVTLPALSFKLSLRLPPNLKADQLIQKVTQTIEKNPPYSARVSFTNATCWAGWNAPKSKAWLTAAIDSASEIYFAKPAAYMGEGGSIPFMGMLGEKFPQAQFMITGVLGPESNAHGPNEFLHVPTVKKLTACIAHVIAEHYAQRPG